MKNELVLQLYEQYSDDLYRFAYAYLGYGEDAEDVVQQVFLKLIKNNISISIGKEKAYLMSMTANTCKDLLKSGSVRKKMAFEDIYGTVKETFSSEEFNLIGVMKELPEKYRAALHLHYFEGYTIKEISKILKCSSSAVSMRLTRGRKILKDLLVKEELEWEKSTMIHLKK